MSNNTTYPDGVLGVCKLPSIANRLIVVAKDCNSSIHKLPTPC